MVSGQASAEKSGVAQQRPAMCKFIQAAPPPQICPSSLFHALGSVSLCFRIEKLEFLDEHETLTQLFQHYCLCTAYKDSVKSLNWELVTILPT